MDFIKWYVWILLNSFILHLFIVIYEQGLDSFQAFNLDYDYKIGVPKKLIVLKTVTSNCQI